MSIFATNYSFRDILMKLKFQTNYAMKRLIFPLLFFVTLCSYSQSPEKQLENHINIDNLKKHVYTLASDSMAGRETGKLGQKMAAEYISSYFRSQKLDSLGMNSYYQTYNLYNYDQGKAYIKYKTFGKQAEKYPFSSFYGKTLLTHPMKFNDTLSFFYLGYGCQIPNIQLYDKVVVLLLDQSFGKTYEIIKRISKETSARYFVVIFDKSSGIGIFNPNKHTLAQSGIFRIDGLFENFSTKFLEKNSHKYDLSAEHYKTFMQNDDTLMINLAYTNRTVDLFNLSHKELAKKEKTDARNGVKNDITFRNDTAIVFADTKELKKDTIPTENVVAFIEGSDKKNEVIVVSAHYDHIGAYGKKIFYGADDNASGTASIMEMAGALQHLANKGIRPSRSILFVALSGEEIGLRGSDYLVSNCPVPIDSVVLNLNFDMVGRNQDNNEKYNNTVYFLAYGKQRKLFKRITKNIGKKNDALNISFHPGFGNRFMWKFSSDHYRFKRINIPFGCFFTGLHPDYHTPRDTPDKINYEKLTEITKAGVVTLWQIANSKKKMIRNVKFPTKKNLIEKMMD